jgi:hypothetical protein
MSAAWPALLRLRKESAASVPPDQKAVIAWYRDL